MSSAVESGPPDTASMRTLYCARSAKSAAASVGETGGWAGGSAAGTLLFPLDALLQARRGAGIFASELAEGGAGRLLLLERRERLPQSHQGVGCLRGFFELGRDSQKGFGRLAIALALEEAFSDPIIGFRHQPIARILAQKAAEILLRHRIILAHQVAVG